MVFLLSGFCWVKTGKFLICASKLSASVTYLSKNKHNTRSHIKITQVKLVVVVLMNNRCLVVRFVYTRPDTPLLIPWGSLALSDTIKNCYTPQHTCTLDPMKSEWVMPPRHSVGTHPETSSHSICQETFDHRHLSLLSHCGLILA